MNSSSSLSSWLEFETHNNNQNKYGTIINILYRTDYISSFPNFVTFLLTFVVLIVAVFRIIEAQTRKNEGEVGKKIKLLDNIPVYSSLPFGLRLPTLIETVILAPQIKKEGIKIFERAYLQFLNEPIVKFPFLNDHMLVIKCPSLIQKILGSTNKHVLNKPQHFCKYFLPHDLSLGLLGAELDIWSPHRKILNRCFTYRAIQSFTKIMNRNSNLLIFDLMENSSKNGINFNNNDNSDRLVKVSTNVLSDKLYFHALNIISEITMGERIFTQEENSSFHSHLIKTKSILAEKLLNPQDLIPAIWWFNPKKKEFDYNLSQLMKYVGLAIQRSKERIQNSPNPPQQSEKEENVPFRPIVEEMIYNNIPERLIPSEVFTFLLAGHETTATAIKYFLQHIAEYPETQKLCQEEIDSIFDSKLREGNPANLKDLTMNDLANLKYVERCILETLRITPVIPFNYRQLSAPMEVNGYEFAKDTVFIFPIWAIQRDPKIYPNPGKFDPDRFLPENMQKRSSYAFLPFSHGPRNCIGYKVAIMEMKIILGWILRHFDVSTTDKLKDMKIDFDLTTVPEREFNIALSKRVAK